MIRVLHSHRDRSAAIDYDEMVTAWHEFRGRRKPSSRGGRSSHHRDKSTVDERLEVTRADMKRAPAEERFL